MFCISYLFTAVLDGEVLMLASQEKVTYKDPLKQDTSAFEALESFAGMSGNCLLRNIAQDGATYAFIMRKGEINNNRLLKKRDFCS